MLEEVQTALKRTKKGREPDIDEVCAEMIIAVGEVGVSWMKRLLNSGAVERGFNSGGLEDRVNCVDMEGGKRCLRSGEVQGHYTPKSCRHGSTFLPYRTGYSNVSELFG